MGFAHNQFCCTRYFSKLEWNCKSYRWGGWCVVFGVYDDGFCSEMNIIFPNLPWYLWIILISIVLIISFFIWVKIFFSKEIQTKIAIQKVNKYFSYLFERGFRMEQADYYPEG